jgi:hypothetical protein
MREQLVAWRGDEIRPSFVLTVRSLIISREYFIHFPPERSGFDSSAPVAAD